jgi:predicted transcriptional regulator of viral defense system
MYSKTCVYCVAKGEYCGFTVERWEKEYSKRESKAQIAQEYLEGSF